MQTPTIIAVDIGNTAAKVAFEVGGTLHERSLPVDDHDWPDSAMQWATKAWATEAIEARQMEWRVASVRPEAQEILTDYLFANFSDAHVKLVTRDDIPMETTVDEPERLGIDRLISGYAASLHTSGPLIVVDAGSAITVDFVSRQHRFEGGAILPGLAMQFASLARGTACLPLLQHSGKQPEVPAKNTEDAILSGVLMGAAAAIDRLIVSSCDHAELTSADVPIFLTGGDAPFLSPHLRHNHTRMNNLVCRGLLRLRSSA